MIINRYILIPGYILYALSLCTVSFYYLDLSGDLVESHGIALLLLGWGGFLAGADNILLGLCWTANFFLFYSWEKTLHGKYDVSLIANSVAIILAAVFMSVSEIPAGNGSMQRVVEYGIGYWCWLISMVLSFLSTTFSLNKSKHSDANKTAPGV